MNELANQMLVFLLGKESYGIRIQELERIIETSEVVLVPRAPDFVLGVVNYRGRIVTVVDIALFLHLHRGLSGVERVLLLAREGSSLGLAVGDIKGIVSIDGGDEEGEGESTEAQSTSGSQLEEVRGGPFIQQVARHRGRAVSIIDTRKFASELEEYF